MIPRSHQIDRPFILVSRIIRTDLETVLPTGIPLVQRPNRSTKLKPGIRLSSRSPDLQKAVSELFNWWTVSEVFFRCPHLYDRYTMPVQFQIKLVQYWVKISASWNFPHSYYLLPEGLKEEEEDLPDSALGNEGGSLLAVVLTMVDDEKKPGPDKKYRDLPFHSLIYLRKKWWTEKNSRSDQPLSPFAACRSRWLWPFGSIINLCSLSFVIKFRSFHIVGAVLYSQ